MSVSAEKHTGMELYYLTNKTVNKLIREAVEEARAEQREADAQVAEKLGESAYDEYICGKIAEKIRGGQDAGKR